MAHVSVQLFNLLNSTPPSRTCISMTDVLMDPADPDYKFWMEQAGESLFMGVGLIGRGSCHGCGGLQLKDLCVKFLNLGGMCIL